MAGGIWTSQNKDRPGAYVNFRTVPRPAMTIGDRGIATMMVPLPWGAENVMIDVFSEELASGDSMAKIGLTAADPEAKLLAGMLSWCSAVKIFRGDTGGTKATASVTGLEIEAKHKGAFGNKITIVVEGDGLLWRVYTLVDGITKDIQVVSVCSELDDNDYVAFDGEAVAPVASAGIALSGGMNGIFTESTRYPVFFSIAEESFWQVLACTTTDPLTKNNVVQFVEDLRDRQGRYVQAVVANYNVADHEGIISVLNGFGYSNGVKYNAEEAVAVVAGIMAGTPIASTGARGVSNTGLVMPNADIIIGELKHNAIVQALRQGHIVFTRNVAGDVKIEQDINTLHTFTADRGEAFRKNRTVRTIDEIGTRIRVMWEQTYMGHVNNDPDGRAMFRADIVSYLSALQNMGVIQEFAGAEHVDVQPGDAVDAIVVNIQVKPLHALEFLYMTALVRV